MAPLVVMVDKQVLVDLWVLLLKEEVDVEPVVVDLEMLLVVEEEIQGTQTIQIRIQSQI